MPDEPNEPPVPVLSYATPGLYRPPQPPFRWQSLLWWTPTVVLAIAVVILDPAAGPFRMDIGNRHRQERLDLWNFLKLAAWISFILACLIRVVRHRRACKAVGIAAPGVRRASSNAVAITKDETPMRPAALWLRRYLIVGTIVAVQYFWIAWELFYDNKYAYLYRVFGEQLVDAICFLVLPVLAFPLFYFYGDHQPWWLLIIGNAVIWGFGIVSIWHFRCWLCRRT